MFKKLMFIFLIISTAHAADVTLQWDANPEPDLAGYNVHYGLQSGNHTEIIDVGNVTEYIINELDDNTFYFFTVAAYDTENMVGDKSNEVYNNNGLPPGVVENCRIVINTETVIINTGE